MKYMENKKVKISDYNILVIILLVIILLVVFLFKKEDKEKAINRHKRLTKLIEGKETLKKKLNKRFKIVYFGVRFVLISIWLALSYILYYYGYIKDVGDFLNYSEITILVIIGSNFMLFGSLSNINNYIDFIKIKTENLVYGKYINIDEEIDRHKEADKIVLDKIKTIENEIDEIKEITSF